MVFIARQNVHQLSQLQCRPLLSEHDMQRQWTKQKAVLWQGKPIWRYNCCITMSGHAPCFNASEATHCLLTYSAGCLVLYSGTTHCREVDRELTRSFSTAVLAQCMCLRVTCCSRPHTSCSTLASPAILAW